jgi:hypothetical protein
VSVGLAGASCCDWRIKRPGRIALSLRACAWEVRDRPLLPPLSNAIRHQPSVFCAVVGEILGDFFPLPIYYLEQVVDTVIAREAEAACRGSFSGTFALKYSMVVPRSLSC